MFRIIDGEKMNVVGKQIRKIQKKKNMSQQELSNKLETIAVYICRGSISRIEDQQRTVTDIELLDLAEVLGVPISALFNTDSNE